MDVTKLMHEAAKDLISHQTEQRKLAERQAEALERLAGGIESIGRLLEVALYRQVREGEKLKEREALNAQRLDEQTRMMW